jgi:hypothetical protein
MRSSTVGSKLLNPFQIKLWQQSRQSKLRPKQHRSFNRCFWQSVASLRLTPEVAIVWERIWTQPKHRNRSINII